MAAFLIALGVLFVAAVLVYYFPEQTESVFMKVLTARRIFVAVFGIIFALVLFSSGVFFLQILGGIIFLYMILTIMFDPTLSGLRRTLAGLPVVGVVFD